MLWKISPKLRDRTNPNSLDKHHIQPQTMRDLTSVYFVPLHLSIWQAEFDYIIHNCFHFITSCSGVQEYKYKKLIITFALVLSTVYCTHRKQNVVYTIYNVIYLTIEKYKKNGDKRTNLRHKWSSNSRFNCLNTFVTTFAHFKNHL